MPYRSSRCSTTPDRHAVPAGQVGPVPPQSLVAVGAEQRQVGGARAAGAVPPSRRAARSTTSAAITRYVVYLPPATSISPSIGSTTACSRDELLERATSASPDSSGRSPA